MDINKLQFDIAGKFEIEKTDVKNNINEELGRNLEIEKIDSDYEKEKAVIESLLFISGKPLELKVIANAINKGEKTTEAILDEMIETRQKNAFGLDIQKADNTYILCTKKELAEDIYSVFDERKPKKLTNASMEVLSIIAYNPNMTKGGIEQIRGVPSDYLVNKLMDYGLVKEVGKQDIPGKPMGYATTEKFLLTFGIENLAELPNLPEISLDNI